MDKIATNTKGIVLEKIRAGSESIQINYLEQSIRALGELWKLKWEGDEHADMRLFRSSQDLVLAVNLSVVACEGVFLDINFDKGYVHHKKHQIC